MGLFQKAMMFKAGKAAFNRYSRGRATTRPGVGRAAGPRVRGRTRGRRRSTVGTLGRLASSLLGGRRRY